jgi:hypothetical protein
MEEEVNQAKAGQTFLQFLGIYPEERGIFIILGLILFCNAFATQIASVAAVSGFIKSNGVEDIPALWMIDMGLILLVAGFQSFIIDRFDRSKLLKTMLLGFACIFFLLRISFYLEGSDWLNYGLMLIISDQQWMFFPLILWTFAQDIFSPAQTKRLFSPIASLGFIGQFTGLVVISVAPHLLAKIGIVPADLLLFNVVVYLFAFTLAFFGLKNVRAQKNLSGRSNNFRSTLGEGWKFVQEIPAFRYLAICVLAVNLSLTFVEFGFLVATQRAFSSNYQTFYGLYRLGLVITSSILQGFVTNRILQKLDLKNTFIVMPLALVFGSIWMLFSGTVSAIGGMLLSKIAQFAADDSAQRSFQSLVPEERRGRVSTFLESTLFGVGVMLASLLIWGALFLGNWIGQEQASYIYRGFALVTGLWAVWAAIRVSQVYDSSLLDWRLKRRERSSSILNKIEF